MRAATGAGTTAREISTKSANEHTHAARPPTCTPGSACRRCPGQSGPAWSLQSRRPPADHMDFGRQQRLAEAGLKSAAAVHGITAAALLCQEGHMAAQSGSSSAWWQQHPCSLGCMGGSRQRHPTFLHPFLHQSTMRTLTLSNRGSFTPATLSWLARTLTDACSRRRWAHYGWLRGVAGVQATGRAADQHLDHQDRRPCSMQHQTSCLVHQAHCRATNPGQHRWLAWPPSPDTPIHPAISKQHQRLAWSTESNTVCLKSPLEYLAWASEKKEACGQVQRWCSQVGSAQGQV